MVRKCSVHYVRKLEQKSKLLKRRLKIIKGDKKLEEVCFSKAYRDVSKALKSNEELLMSLRELAS